MTVCSKTRYASRFAARRALAEIRRHPVTALQHFGRTGKIPCRAYHCASCAGWHLTSEAKA